MIELSEYSNAELERLYNRLDTYAITYSFLYIRRYKPETVNEDGTLGVFKPHYTNGKPMVDEDDGCPDMLFNIIAQKNIESQLEDHKYKNKNEFLLLSYMNEMYKTVLDCYFWFWGSKNMENEYVQERYTELHMNDELDAENDRDNRYHLLQFVWNTLQYCSIEELNKLIRLSESKYKVPKKYNKKDSTLIYMIDMETLDKVGTYYSRSVIIEELGIKKNTLSDILKKSAENPKAPCYWRKWKNPNDNKIYTFIEEKI